MMVRLGCLSNPLIHSQEEQKFESIEKEYERAFEIAKEDELELGLAKKMLLK